ncbi:hypothetical protein HQ571_04850 [Candidatus Kuenenbacteria bacterium]|nr:hypothetical protein [Candidatus Kuenenbacteria bacterium]
MNCLIIFDTTINFSKFTKTLSNHQQDDIYLFSLTLNPKIISKVTSCLTESDIKNFHIIESSKLIDSSVDTLRKKIHKSIAEIGNTNINKKTVKQWFKMPHNDCSTWWFSELSEKNTTKNPSFFKMAQVNTIYNQLSSHKIQSCLFFSDDSSFSKSLKQLCKKNSVSFFSNITKKRKVLTARDIFKACFDSDNTILIFFRALISLINRILRTIQARITLGAPGKKSKNSNNELMFISYFPCVDPKKIQNDDLRNKFAIKLEDKIKKIGKKIIWLWLFAYVDDRSYKESLNLAKLLRQKGETGYLLDQFLTIKSLLKTIYIWFHQILIFTRIRRHLLKILVEKFSEINLNSLKRMCSRSFIGWPGLEAILHFELFQNVIKKFPAISKCIYLSEMHPWEVALNLSKNIVNPKLQTIGFQHAAISENYFFYYRHPLEFESITNKYPAPDIVACNGDIPFQKLLNSAYPRVEKVEANRYMYLNNYFKNKSPEQKENIVLVATSTDKKESEELITLAYSTFSKLKNFKIWFKGHPDLPIGKILKQEQIPIDNKFFFHKTNPIDTLLPQTTVLLVGDSSVAIEALAFGCKVIIPVSCNCMFLSPLKGFENLYYKIYNTNDLTDIAQSLNQNVSHSNIEKAHEFIKQYWCLDENFARWEKLIK